VIPNNELCAVVEAQPYPLIFVTISGAHLYGFPSPDSDYDLRGVHVLPVEQVVSLNELEETVEVSEMHGDLQIDLVSHDARKYFEMLLKRNGYVLEQIFSPLIVNTSPEHVELKRIAQSCITRHHSHHYFGFAKTQWDLFAKDNPPRVKPLLYVLRVLLTGIHLMQTGDVEANLVALNHSYNLPYIPELIARKLDGAEKSTLRSADLDFYQREYERLLKRLEQANAASTLPETPSGKAALSDLLVQLRLKQN
jgi:predicted nucleotidyltransferase